MYNIKFEPLKCTAIFRKSQSRTCWRYFFADCSKHERDFRRKYQRERGRREKYQRFQTRKTYSTAAEHSRDEARSNADLITGQTSRESRPGRDFISSAVGEMRRCKAGRRERKSRKRERERIDRCCISALVFRYRCLQLLVEQSVSSKNFSGDKPFLSLKCTFVKILGIYRISY